MAYGSGIKKLDGAFISASPYHESFICELSGLYIEERRMSAGYRPISAATIVLSGTAVVSWKIYTGDWNTAFALGSYLVGTVAIFAMLSHSRP